MHIYIYIYIYIYITFYECSSYLPNESCYAFMYVLSYMHTEEHIPYDIPITNVSRALVSPPQKKIRFSGRAGWQANIR